MSSDLKGSVIGAIVTDEDGRTLFERGADLRLAPASNQKLFTVAYALDRLGPEYRSATRFWTDDAGIFIDSDGTLDLGYKELKALADRLGRRPKATLRQAYRRGRPGTWEIEDAPNRYAPAIAAFACERGGVELWMSEGGEPEIRPAPLGLTIAEGEADAQPIAGGMAYDPFRGVVYRNGAKPRPGRIDTLSQPQPDLAAAALFGETVERNDSDPARERRRAPDATLLTDSLLAVAPRCLQPSDNYLAESLFEMAKLRGMPPKRWGVERVGLEPNTYDPKDGSGLSREDVVTARAIARLLRWTRRQPWGAGYRAALARPGVGTLKSRLAGSDFQGKTGSLAGVSSLSGFVRSSGGRTRVVSLLVNGYACPVARVHDLQDRFVRAAALLR